MSLAVGTTLMMGKVYMPSMVGEIARVTPTLYILRLDDGRECRVWKIDMRVVGGDLQTFRVVAAEGEGKKFYYSRPPKDGNPGQPVQCRCWAEPDFDVATLRKLNGEEV